MSLAKNLQPLPALKKNRFDDWFLSLSNEQKSIITTIKYTLEPLFNSAPYLAHICEKNADWLCAALPKSADDILADLFIGLEHAGKQGDNEENLSILLRQTKLRVALLCAIAETGKVWSAEKSTAALADLADKSLETSLEFLIRQAAINGKLKFSAEQLSDKNVSLSEICGLAIFALGKHGGRELNYSSDIDIVAFFDTKKDVMQENVLIEPSEASRFYGRIMRSLVCLMDERSEYGYVFRTDLRLRPDPGSTPVAISIDAALSYYESRGQNWERAAWIKARTCAGDKSVGADFLKYLSPFIWRKHLDFASIADIQAMKRQINIAKNVGAARVEGHNVKLGRGGIREIEFFTQTQQLIAGGRDLNLRVRPTCLALKSLANAGWIEKNTADELIKAYWYLRAVENRLQMINDEQTHIMPQSNEGINTISLLMGEEKADVFREKYQATLNVVMGYYSELFIQEETLASDIGDLVFTGTDDDPNTLDTLQSLGFEDAPLALSTIKKWHYGSYPATRASASRAHLTELLPSLLSIISATGNSDEALARFDHFLAQFPAGVQLLSLLRNNHNLCHMLIAFMASAPRMADAVIHRAHVMDGLIDPAFADGVSDGSVLIEKIKVFLGQANSFEDLIDRARIIGQEQKFLIGAGFISNTVDARLAAEQFSNLAQALLEHLFEAVQKEFEKKHGQVVGAQVGLLAFGKMASKEMTATSDIDFILLYDAPKGEEYSDGDRPLAVSHYFSRLTQRLVAALSAPTAEGVLYEADMRLRPSGNAGPLATSLNAFLKYQKSDAWTWEHLALTRARVIGAEAGFENKINALIKEVLSLPYDKKKVILDVKDMRLLLAKERKPAHDFDLKLVDGGLIDIEFLAQTVQLLEGKKINFAQASVANVINKLVEIDMLPKAKRLSEIHFTYTTILQTMSVCLINPLKNEDWTLAFKDLLAQLTNTVNFERLNEDIKIMQQDVIEITKEFYETI